MSRDHHSGSAGNQIFNSLMDQPHTTGVDYARSERSFINHNFDGGSVQNDSGGRVFGGHAPLGNPPTGPFHLANGGRTNVYGGGAGVQISEGKDSDSEEEEESYSEGSDDEGDSESGSDSGSDSESGRDYDSENDGDERHGTGMRQSGPTEGRGVAIGDERFSERGGHGAGGFRGPHIPHQQVAAPHQPGHGKQLAGDHAYRRRDEVGEPAMGHPGPNGPAFQNRSQEQFYYSKLAEQTAKSKTEQEERILKNQLLLTLQRDYPADFQMGGWGKDTPVAELQYEIDKRRRERDEDQQDELVKVMFTSSIMILESIVMNSPAKQHVNLKGWSDVVIKDYHIYKPHLRALRLMYMRKGFGGHPASQLTWLLICSAFTFHIQNRPSIQQ